MKFKHQPDSTAKRKMGYLCPGGCGKYVVLHQESSDNGPVFSFWEIEQDQLTSTKLHVCPTRIALDAVTDLLDRTSNLLLAATIKLRSK